MKMLDRIEIKGGWSHIAKHIPRVQNTPADDISRWTREQLAEKVRELTSSHDWVEQSIGPRGVRIFDVIPRTKNVVNRHDHLLWNIMVHGQDMA